MPENVSLNPGELATLDALVTVAHQMGYSLDTDDDCENHVCTDHGDVFMGRWQDTRQDGVLIAHMEQVILPRLRELTSRAGDAPTLRRLVELRGEATRIR